MPFDRLVRAVDAWAAVSGRRDLFGQIGLGGYQPRHFESKAVVAPEAFRELVGRSSAVVSHAGMGTILTALELSKPVLLMPRLARHGETRNDHQVATARYFATVSSLVAVADD